MFDIVWPLAASWQVMLVVLVVLVVLVMYISIICIYSRRLGWSEVAHLRSFRPIPAPCSSQKNVRQNSQDPTRQTEPRLLVTGTCTDQTNRSGAGFQGLSAPSSVQATFLGCGSLLRRVWAASDGAEIFEAPLGWRDGGGRDRQARFLQRFGPMSKGMKENKGEESEFNG